LLAAAMTAFCGAAAATYDEQIYLDDGGDYESAGAAPEDGGVAASADVLGISARNAILIEKETGAVIYEKDADAKCEPASVTKIMTMLIIVEAIESGALSLDDIVAVSAYAQSMGGSQIYLKEGERMSVHDMLKAIVVSSANDAAAAMAEHLSGSEAAFAERMNERARRLGMDGTHFTNASGLLDDVTHVTTARDVAVMSRELIAHELIKRYTTIWTDSLRGGEFALSNTNKLIRYYDGATGLKTGFTSRAGYCLAATASREGTEYIAVVMGGASSDARFADARRLLDYAFANYALIDISPDEAIRPLRVKLGKPGYVQPIIKSGGKQLVARGDAASAERTVELPESTSAPIEAGATLGRLIIHCGERVIGEYEIVAGEGVERMTWSDVFLKMITRMFG
jgi:D-alanyl-D-alanine carboxypeptidase (penicillin-binding protein 5/6)